MGLSDLFALRPQRDDSSVGRSIWLPFSILLLVLLTTSSCGDGRQVTSLDATDSGEEISIDAGDRIEIVLESNPTTGYSWSIDEGTSDIVTLVSSRFEAPESDLVGAAGTETFVFEAPVSGAGIIRLVYMRPFDDPPVPERVVEYIVSVDGVAWTRPPDDPPSTSTATAPDQPDGAEPVGVADLFDGEGARDAVVEGFVFIDPGGARLCETLMESFAPQCGGLWVVVANPSGLERLSLTEEQSIRWSDQYVALAGRFDGNRFILTEDAEAAEPTEADRALVAAFFDHAADPDGATAAALPFAEELALGLGSEIVETVPRALLDDPANWQLDVEEHTGFAGPFSALEVARPGGLDVATEITIGPHPNCAGPPVPPPAGYETHRRVSIQPTHATSCIEWWTADFFVGDDGFVEAVTLDLFGP